MAALLFRRPMAWRERGQEVGLQGLARLAGPLVLAPAGAGCQQRGAGSGFSARSPRVNMACARAAGPGGESPTAPVTQKGRGREREERGGWGGGKAAAFVLILLPGLRELRPVPQRPGGQQSDNVSSRAIRRHAAWCR